MRYSKKLIFLDIYSFGAESGQIYEGVALSLYVMQGQSKLSIFLR